MVFSLLGLFENKKKLLKEFKQKYIYSTIILINCVYAILLFYLFKLTKCSKLNINSQRKS